MTSYFGRGEKSAASSEFTSYAQDNMAPAPKLALLPALDNFVQQVAEKLAAVTAKVRQRAVSAVEVAVARGEMNGATGSAVIEAVQEVYTEATFDEAVQHALRPVPQPKLDAIDKEFRDLVNEKYQHCEKARSNKSITPEQRLNRSLDFVTLLKYAIHVQQHKNARHPEFNMRQARTFYTNDLSSLNMVWIQERMVVLTEAFQGHNELRTAFFQQYSAQTITSQFEAFGIVCEPSRNEKENDESMRHAFRSNDFVSGQ